MTKVHIRNGELTIPLSEELREKLDVHEGDELEAYIFPGSVVLRASSAEANKRAWEGVFSIIDRVRARPAQPPLSREKIEEMIVDEVRLLRRSIRP